MKPRFILLLFCFLLSGFSGLAYQTAWSMEFGLVFGASELALVTVLAAYMAGLALGAGIGGHLAYRLKRPILTYAVLELAIGLAALAIPMAIRAVGVLQTRIFGGQDFHTATSSLPIFIFYVVTSFAILLIPTGLMGATLPLLARWAVHRDRDIGPKLGQLYAVNAAGAAAGTLVTAVVLLPQFGLGDTVRIAAGLNLLIFGLALILCIKPNTRSQPETEPIPPKTYSSKSAAFWILPIMLVSGMVSFSWEILWTRLLTHILGGSMYAFATILAAFLTGIALGSAAAARLARTRKGAESAMVFVQLATAVLFLAAFVSLDALEALSQAAHLQGFWVRGAWLSGLVLLPGATAIGATFPLAVRILAHEPAAAARAAARVFSWNTVGAILGAWATGYLLLPAMKFAATATLLVGTSLALAGAASLARAPRRYFGILLTAVALGTLIWRQPPTPWRLLQHSPLGRPNPVAPEKIAHYGVGRSGTILLTEESSSYRLTTNGLPESAIASPWDLPGRFAVARWLSLLPFLARPDAQNQLVIGLGAGITVSDLPETLKEIHVIEIEPEVVRANRSVAERRFFPLDDPRLRLHIHDARGALRLASRQFDAIVSQPSHPWTSSSSNLFTVEFFQIVKDRLNAEGVFVAWLGLAFADAALLQTFVATATHVFPHVELYRPKPNVVILMASKTAWDMEKNSWEALQTAGPQWREIGVLVPEDLLAARNMNFSGARAFAGSAPPNSDYHNQFRTRSPKIIGKPLDMTQVDRLLAGYEALDAAELSEDLGYLVRRLLRQGQKTRAMRFLQQMPQGPAKNTALALMHLTRSHSNKATALLNQVLRADRNNTEARAALLRLRQDQIAQGQPIPLQLQPMEVQESTVVDGWRLQGVGDWAGLRKLEKALNSVGPKHPLFVDALRLRSAWRIHSGDPQTAAQALDLLTPLLAPFPQNRDLLLYAEAAVNAGQDRSALTALDYALSLNVFPRERRETLLAAQRILKSLPNEKHSQAWKENLAARIEKQLKN